MVAAALPEDLARRIEELAQKRPEVDPADIIEVVESVMTSISGDLSAVNLKLYAEIESLARFINHAKAEIAALRPDEIKDRHLATATDELEAIVGSTEAATNQIFEAVESIEALAKTLPPEAEEKITQAVTSVYEACGFQDITGQRITKVVHALQHIEGKVEGLLNAFGQEFRRVPDEAKPETPRKLPPGKTARPDEHLMNGPQRPEDAISQADIDALLGFD
ncbi:MAG: protein phosphatase CheZ [Kiloniellales bacterium]